MGLTGCVIVTVRLSRRRAGKLAGSVAGMLFRLQKPRLKPWQAGNPRADRLKARALPGGALMLGVLLNVITHTVSVKPCLSYTLLVQH